MLAYQPGHMVYVLCPLAEDEIGDLWFPRCQRKKHGVTCTLAFPEALRLWPQCPYGEPPLSTAQGESVPGSHRYLMTVLST